MIDRYYKIAAACLLGVLMVGPVGVLSMVIGTVDNRAIILGLGIVLTAASVAAVVVGVTAWVRAGRLEVRRG